MTGDASVVEQPSGVVGGNPSQNGGWVRTLSPALSSGVSIVLALIVGGVVMGLTLNKGWVAPFQAYRQLLAGAFGSGYAVQETLTDAIPLILGGLAVALPFRAGLFNIGVPGQMYVGAIAATFAGYTIPLAGWLLLPVCLLIGAGAAALWAIAPAVLKSTRGVHEVISTMMLNYIGLNLMLYLLDGVNGGRAPMQGPFPGSFSTVDVHVRFPIIVPSWLATNADLNASILLALVLAVVVWFLVTRTAVGYAIRVVGSNPKAARYAGISVGRTIVVTMALAGACAGLAAASTIFGVAGQLQDGFDGFGYGFDAIAVALLGRNSSTGVVLAAILFGALVQGGAAMQSNYPDVDPHIILVLQGLIILFVGADVLISRFGAELVRRTATRRLLPWMSA